MTEYITKKQAQDILCRGCNKDLHLICRCDKWAEIRRTDGIDIVHCSECRHRVKHHLYQEVLIDNWCEIHGKITNDPTWFCADGKRKPALKHADEETLQSAT